MPVAPTVQQLPDRLVRSFGRSSAVARGSVATILDMIPPSSEASWQLAPRVPASWQPAPRGDPAAVGFAVQSYYALVVRLVTRRLAGPAAERLLDVEPFSWVGSPEVNPLGELAGRLGTALNKAGLDERGDGSAGPGDLFSPLYQDLFPRQLRHALGEHYTPEWLAQHVLDQTGYHPVGQTASLLDPACGSGTFLALAIGRIRANCPAGSPDQRRSLARAILRNVVGFDLQPLAVLSARANYVIALGELWTDLVSGGKPVEVPVCQRDSILDVPVAQSRRHTPCAVRQDAAPPPAGSDSREEEASAGGTRSVPASLDGTRSVPPTMGFDYVVGNPPWIAWDHLPEATREATKPLWREYGLFSLSAAEARHGGGKKDLSALMLYRAADRYLADGGRIGLVIPQTLLQSKGAGDGFRRFKLGEDGPPLRVVRVDDLVDVQPFDTAANWTAVIVLEKGSPTRYPVPYFRWVSATGPSEDYQKQPLAAEPIDPQRPASPWFLRPQGLKVPMGRLAGPSDYRAHLGANTGGANGVYWLDVLAKTADGLRVRNVAGRGKRAVPTVETVIEPDLVYPLVRWGNLRRYGAPPSGHLLLAQDVHTRRGIDEDRMRADYPRTYAYLKRFTGLLTGRAAYRRYQHAAAFYSMYNVGAYTLAPVKVVWRRMDRRMTAAVVEPIDDPHLGRRPVIPQETCALVPAETPDEAHYLCAVLNSAVVNFLVASHSVRGGKGFGTPSLLDHARLCRFQPENPLHAELAAQSRTAHEIAAAGGSFAEVQDRIDRAAALLWELDAEDLEVMRPT